MRYGVAIDQVVWDKRRAWRKGWNGKGQYLVERAGYPQGVSIDPKTAKEMGKQPGEVVAFGPYVTIVAVDGSVHPWTASQADVHADDWEVS